MMMSRSKPAEGEYIVIGNGMMNIRWPPPSTSNNMPNIRWPMYRMYKLNILIIYCTEKTLDYVQNGVLNSENTQKI